MDSVLHQLLSHFQLPLHNPVLIFSLILFIILLAPIAMERIRLPGIIGLIVSGIIIGPAGLNILEQSLFVEVFSTIGLLYIMFIAGLELDLIEFDHHKHKSILFGCFTFFIPLAIGLPVCLYLFDYNLYASLLIASVFATHTLVAYPIASKLGVTKNLSVAVAVGGTILTDATVLIVLAIILGANDGGLTLAFWVQLGISIAVFTALTFLVVPRIAAWFFNHLEGESYSHYIFVLAIVFLTAFLSEIAGLEAIIGAFAAGLALNKLIPHSSALMHRIEFIGNSLFIPFFLISVGMVVDVGVIIDAPETLIIAGALTVVAVAGKYLAAFATQLSFGMSADQRNLIFGLSSAHAAATLAVILVGYRAGIIGDVVLNAIVIIILISCVIASFMTEHAAKNIANQSDGADDSAVTATLEMEQILIPLSNTEQIERLLNLAVLIKEPKSTHPLALLNVVTNTDEAEKTVALTKREMEEFLSEATATNTEVNVLATIDDNKGAGISRVTREIAADLLITGWPQRTGALFDKLTGNRTESILYHTAKTLFVCKLESSIASYKSLVVIVPPRAELEIGFPIWMAKMFKLASELSSPITIHCNERTFQAVTRFAERNKSSPPLNHENVKNWRQLPARFRKIADSSLLILVSARLGHISRSNHLSMLPATLEKHHPKLDKIVIYPE